jgi:hypothetical protein
MDVNIVARDTKYETRHMVKDLEGMNQEMFLLAQILQFFLGCKRDIVSSKR